MKRLLLSSLLLFLSSYSYAYSTQADSQHVLILSEDDYVIMKPQMSGLCTPHYFSVLLDSSSRDYSELLPSTLIKHLGDSLGMELLTEFLRLKNSPKRIEYKNQRLTGQSIDYSRLMLTANALGYNGDRFWRIREIYPNFCALVDFSQIAYSKDKNWAVFYIGYMRGDLDGEGRYYIMKRENGRWKEVFSKRVWVS
jgi:hypothetical protein